LAENTLLRIEQIVEKAMLGEDLFAIVHHPVDDRQFVDDEEIELGQPDLAHLHRIAAFEQRVDPAHPAGEEALEQGGFVLVRNRIGRGEQEGGVRINHCRP
jgi:hypothetical protein